MATALVPIGPGITVFPDSSVIEAPAMFATIDRVPGAAYMRMAWPPAYAEHHRRVDVGSTRGLMSNSAKK